MCFQLYNITNPAMHNDMLIFSRYILVSLHEYLLTHIINAIIVIYKPCNKHTKYTPHCKS